MDKEELEVLRSFQAQIGILTKAVNNLERQVKILRGALFRNAPEHIYAEDETPGQH